MRNIRLRIAYDGSPYVGWQVQPNGPSIQATVERAIGRLTGEQVSVLAAGRTDSGVHALGQVASFRTSSMIPGDRFATALQKFLPADIVALDSDEVPLEFHATFSAVRKRYRYIICNQRTILPFVRRYAYQYSFALDVDAMHEAAQALIGTHDFRSFETQFPNKATSVRTVMECSVRRTSGWPMWNVAPGEASGTGPYIWLDIVANGFLYNMVRTIAGTLLRTGRGFWDASDVRRIIAAQDRGHAGDTAPACGLYLVQVDYPPLDQLNQRLSRLDEQDAACGE